MIGKVIDLLPRAIVALIRGSIVRCYTFSNPHSARNGDHVVNGQKTTLRLELLPSMHYRQNSLSQKTIKFLRLKIPAFASKLVSLVKHLLIHNVSGYG